MKSLPGRSFFLSAVLLALSFASYSAQSTDRVGVELNKMEQSGETCRAFLIVENRSATALSSIRLDLVLFDTDGIILERFALNVAPVAANKTSVKSFDIPETSCGGIGRILLNDVLECENASGPVDRCMDIIEVSNRGGVRFFK